jgi:apolipoprotein N-acyltransferase
MTASSGRSAAGMRRWIIGSALASTAGVVWALCFARRPLPWAAWLALAPLILLLRHRHAARLAWLFGLAYWVVAVWWIAPTLRTYGQMPWPGAWLLMLVLAVYLSLYTLVFGWLGARLWRVGGWALLLGAPALWVVLEWLRGVALTGFPWNLAAYAWTEVPGALPLAAWVGAWGVSFLVVFVNTAIAWAWTRRRPAIGLAGVLGALVVLAMAARWAAPRPASVLHSGAAIRIVQPNIENLVEWDEPQVMRDYRTVIEISDAACDRPGSLIIWPESAAWPFEYATSPLLQRDISRLSERGCSVLFNTVTEDGDKDFNSALLVSPHGAVERYDKRHLVPFGEYVPLGGLLPWVRQIARNAGAFTAADGTKLLRWRGQSFGTAICFEIVFPREVVDLVRAGATALVTMTNDAWYGDTAAPWQHLRAARFRAAETHRTVLRAAITGVSAWIRPDGSIADEIGVYRRGILRGDLNGRGDETFFVRVPWLVPLISLLLAVSAIFWAVWSPR